MEGERINIVLADSQFLIGISLKTIFESLPAYHLVGIAENYNRLTEFLSSGKVSLLIIDVLLFDIDSFQRLADLREKHPELKFLILTNSLNKSELNEMMRLGIKSIIYKTTDNDELLQAIEATLKNKKYYCSEVLDMLVDSSAKNAVSDPFALTPAETEVVKLIAGGFTTKEIAQKKHVSFHTVMSHRKNIFRKLKINNVSELLMYALRVGIIEDNTEYYI
ncbi:MAG: response regulator transcription factor [Bacteroidales bacterium]|nr:response regulator transcription factor [Bacteroidales bacterium]